MGSRRSHVLAQALLLGAYGLASLAHAQADTPIVAVFAIEGRDTRLPPRSLAALTEYLSTRLSSSGAFAVIPTDEVKRRLDEQKSASYKACYDQACQIEIGKELAAQHSVSTQVARLGGPLRGLLQAVRSQARHRRSRRRQRVRLQRGGHDDGPSRTSARSSRDPPRRPSPPARRP
jgi:hypothetical protein